ncbi:MAG: M6 family metalloprotease domain-containing protein [Prevotella sp.]|nr:M6 family metalloprotease domain-containing protein [Prevotella sp.]
MKRFLTIFVLAVLALSASAVPAKRGLVRTLTLSDGTTVTAKLVGDEHGHYWLAEDGKAYLQEEGTAYFAQVNLETVKTKAQTRRNQSNARRSKRLAPNKVGEVGNYTGKKKGIIILVNFSDVSFQSSNNNALYQRVANEENFSYGNFKGSMYDFFYAQSEGQFELTFDVVGPVTVSNKQSYYGSNDSSGNDKYPATMVIEALKLADSQVNYADYDWDGDGEVDQVYVVYAGKGEADGGASSTIWPHEWNLSAANYYGDGAGAQTLDGVKIDTYACGGELNGQTGSIAGIGTMCHEFSHCLGYPDFYDTDYSGGQGMGYWDLMDSGSYNDDGYQPAGYTSYERWVAGWKTPIELTTTKAVSNMKALQDGGESYIIYNQGNTNEYFLLENRQLTGWDESVPGAGLLILHVDYSSSAWSSNTPNDTPSHQRMTWIAADNKYEYTTYSGTKYYDFDGMATDPFPYGTANAFGKSTTPAAKLFNQNTDGTYYLDSSVENITQNSDGTVSFNFVGLSSVATPTFSPAAGRYTEAQTVTISCETEGATIYYTTDGTTPTSGSTKYTGAITISETTTLKAIAIADGEESAVATAKYYFGSSSADVKTFKRVTSLDEMVSGMRYIIACGSKAKAAGSLSSSYFSPVSVTLEDDIITITDDVTVFLVEGSGNSFSFLKEDTESSTVEYLCATTTKKLAYDSDEKTWTLADDKSGVIMTYGSYGTMLYNARDPRFTTYTSGTQSNMIYANLYMEYETETPTEKQDVTMAFSESEVTATVGEDFTEPTLTTDPEGLTVTYSSSETSVATVNESTGAVTLVGEGTAVITATFAGNDSYNSGTASYTLTVNAATPVEKQDVTMTFSSESATATMGDEFTAPTLTIEPEGLTVTYSSSNTSVATVDKTTGTVTLVGEGTTTITATFAGNDNYNSGSASYTLTVSSSSTSYIETDNYELVTDASTLAAGDKIVITNTTTAADTQKALGTTQNKNNRSATNDFTFNDDATITPGDGVAIIQLGGQSGAWTFYVTNGDSQGYLYAASSYSNYLRTESEVDSNNNAEAAISIVSDTGAATIEFQGTNSRNLLKYNSQNYIFSCYASGQNPVYIYRQIKIIPVAYDINKDGQISIADVTALVNIILGKDSTEPYVYDHDAADVNSDGEIEIADVTALVNILLGKE